MFLSSLLSVYAIDIFEPIAKWLTIGILACALLTGTLIFFLKRKAFSAFLKYAFFSLASYLLIMAILFFAFDIAYHYSDGYAQENWLDKQTLIRLVLVPLLAMACVLTSGLALGACGGKEETEKDEASVIITRRPCILLDRKYVKPAYKVDTDKCRNCGKCMKLGCPSIKKAENHVEIDDTLCTGCGLCADICPFGAIVEGGK